MNGTAVRLPTAIGAQRAIVAALAEGKLGYHSEHVPTDAFDATRQPIVQAVLSYRSTTGQWPGRNKLGIISPEHLTEEASAIAATDTEMMNFITPKALEMIQRIMLKHLAKAAAEQAVGFGSTDLDTLRNQIEDIHRLGEPPAKPFDFMHYLREDRWNPEDVGTMSPIPLPNIGEVKPGLKAGEHGLIMAPTKKGKSFFCVWLALEAMKTGLDVVYITLEVTPEELSERFIRGMVGSPLGVDPEEYLARCLAFKGKQPDIRYFPRYSIGTGMVKDIVRRKHQEVGDKFVCIVDYGALLKSPAGAGDARHASVGMVHANLCAIAQEYRIPIWSPFQTNRGGSEDGGTLRAHHAGESYIAMTHVDLVLSLQQTPDEENLRMMTVATAASRSSAYAEDRIIYDWNKIEVKPALP